MGHLARTMLSYLMRVLSRATFLLRGAIRGLRLRRSDPGGSHMLEVVTREARRRASRNVCNDKERTNEVKKQEALKNVARNPQLSEAMRGFVFLRDYDRVPREKSVHEEKPRSSPDEGSRKKAPNRS